MRFGSKKDMLAIVSDACANCGISIEARDTLTAYINDLYRVNNAATSALNWRLISTLSQATKPDDMVLSACPPCSIFPQGRVMIWRAGILADNIKRGNDGPAHLRYPATLWRPVDTPDWSHFAP